ncbi:MAG: hypothetical protein KDB02_00360 [Acidimicrobiales bacterium]|nr:hypothetical protein [Acidimicrobiales bacterium]
MDQALNRILADDFLAGIGDVPVSELRASRATCRDVETKFSYLRRLIQGHHDVVTAEVRRRAEGGSPDDVTALVERLPSILADRVRAPGAGRLTATMEPGELSGEMVDKVDEVTGRVPLDGLTSVPAEVLEDAAESLAGLESEVSAIRRSLFDRIDAIEAELTRRYRDGEASVDDLLVDAGPTES